MHESPEQVDDFLSVNKNTRACTHGRHHSDPLDMSFHLFHFHSPVSSFSCTLLLCSHPLFSFSAAALLFFFSIISPSLSSPASHSSSLLLFLSLFLSCLAFFFFFSGAFSLPEAISVYISVVYFYKCQTVFLPSIY